MHHYAIAPTANCRLNLLEYELSFCATQSLLSFVFVSKI
jgi:hypothetical protein